MSTTTQRRKDLRQTSESQVIRIQIKDRMGNPKWLTADLLNTSAGGIGISLRTQLAAGSEVVVRGKLNEAWGQTTNPAVVKWCTEKINGNFHAGLELGDSGIKAQSETEFAAEETAEEPDCYEILQLNPKADADTIQRVYRILAQRYHPDTQGTGSRETFLKVCEAHRILSDPELRAKYDTRYRETKQIERKIFDRAQAVKGPEEERRKRQGILELLYAKTAEDPERATLTVLDFEQLLGCPREQLQFALWYLRGKGYVARGDNGRFTITVPGSDEVESYRGQKEKRNTRLLESGGVAL